MKIISFIFLVYLLYACGFNSETTVKVTKQSYQNAIQHLPSLHFIPTTQEGFLMGNRVKLYDENLNFLSDISSMNEKKVSILGVSDTLYNEGNTKGMCDSYRYVKVKIKEQIGIVYGKYVYRPINSTLNRKHKNVLFQITSNFGLTEKKDFKNCSYNYPLILIDNENNIEGFVKMQINENYLSTYPYFHLTSTIDQKDNIINIQETKFEYLVKIQTSYNISSFVSLLSIKKSDIGSFEGTILENEKIN